MIVKAWNDAQVVYQIPLEDQIANSALVIHRDAGGTLVISQEDQAIVIDLHRGNIKQLFSAIQKVLDATEQAARKK